MSVTKSPVFCLEDLVIEAFRDATAVIGYDLQLLTANQAMAEALPGEWLERCPLPLSDVLPVVYEEYGWFEQMVRERHCVHNRVLNFVRNGKTRTYLVDSHQVYERQGKPVGILVFMKDIGNIVSLEHTVHHNEKLATVGKIAAGVAHEIRNPLTSIKGFLQIMRTDLLENGMQKAHSFTDVMLSEIERVNALVGELLLLSKPREMKMETLEAEEVILSLAPLISSESILNNIEFHLSLQTAPQIMADRELVKQVLLNLMKNAIEAMSETSGGELTITNSYVADERMVRIEIRDSGPGIPHYMLDRIFDAFFTTKETGTGLGLPICQRLVSDMGGQIKVTSKGYGTTFAVWLPVAGK